MTEQDHIDGYREWFLSGEELDATRTKIAALNRRAVRRGFTGRIKVEARPATRSHVPAQGAPTVTEHGFAVTISGEPPCYSGWRFIAAADVIPQRPATAADQPAGAAADSPGIAAGAPRVVLRYAPGADPIDNASVRPGECDHCHTVRARGTTFLVQHERSGELRQVGRSCLKDFLGHTALPVFIDADQIADQVERSMRGAPQAAAWDLHSVLTYAWATVETHGWAPASSPHSTRDLVAQALAGGPHSTEVLASIRAKLPEREQMARRIVTDLINGLEGRGGYEANLLSILNAGVVYRRNHLGLAVSAITAWHRISQADPRSAKPEPSRTIGHAGEVGATITLSGTITTAMWIDGYHHNSPPQRLIIRDCGDAVAKMITAAGWADDIHRGEPLTVTATVKAHTDYHGVPQTVLVRPKRLDHPQVADPHPAPAGPAWEQVRQVPPQARF